MTDQNRHNGTTTQSHDCIQGGDINELGNIVAGAFAHPDQAGHGEYLPLVGDFLSFNDIVDTLNRPGHHFSVIQVPLDPFPAEQGY